MMEEKYDAIVVGAGFGGSACAALLAKRGLKTLLLDKNALPGGKAMTASKEGFRYEYWPIIGVPSLHSRFHAVLKELDAEDQVELLTPTGISALLYKRRGGRYEMPPNLPAEEQDEGPLGMVRQLGLTEEELPRAGPLFADMTSMQPEEIDRLDDVTLAGFLSRYDVPQPVLSAFGMWANVVYAVPVDLLAASEAIKTYQDFARGAAMRYSGGGFGRVAEVFTRAVERYGGRVLMRTRVERIVVEDGAATGVVTDQGIFRAPIVISNAGIHPTVLRLVGEHHFDTSYLGYVKGLVPSWGIMGVRYFLSRPVLERGVYIAFSDDSYLDTERYLDAKAGRVPDEVTVLVVVPERYDPTLAPEGKQCVLAGTICSADPDAPDAELWWGKLEEMVGKLWPEVEGCTEAKERYTSHHVSALSRDQVLPGQGGEAVGLAYYVGTDAGGYGCGTHQAVDSAINVAAAVEKEHRARVSMA
jgi:prolycopene isomerase